ncbi:MAG: TonB-dependent receptor, partial [Acidobacteria bacterium]|nr:TonB-dependent receptor [Acidobacteriota bacterium]
MHFKVTRTPRVLITGVLLLGYLVQGALTQTVTGTILGTVKDTSGALVPDASVEIRNTETGATRVVQTDERGAYRALRLSPGNYQVQVSKPGFKVQLRTGITLSVAQEATIDVTLEVGEVTETVTVSAEAPLVETAGSATVSGLVTNEGIQDLPLNGRSFEQLAILQPGVVANTQSGGDFFGGRTLKISVGGARGSQNTYLLDGTTIDNVWNSTPGSATGLMLGVETIREFRVLVNNYSAEYGKNAGGVVNIVTLSGTNTLHGTLYEFLRNSALDAKNFFDDPKQPIPPFKRNQFGASVGGPIQRDKFFFHANYEGVRDRKGLTHAAAVLDEQAQKGFLPDPSDPSKLINVGIDPRVQPYVKLLPLPNGRTFGNGVAEWLGTSTQPASEDYFSGRLDYTISENDSIFGRYTFDDGGTTRVGALPILGSVEASRSHYATIQETHVFSPSLLSTFRIGFARNWLSLQPVQLVPLSPSLNFRSGRPFGAAGGIVVPALSAGLRGDPLSNCLVCPLVPVLNNFEWAGTVDWIKGRHTIKAGGQISRLQFNTTEFVAASWQYFFPSITSWFQAQPLFILGSPVESDPVRGLRQTMYAGFLQDEIQVWPNFNLSLGLRYENMRAPMEVNGKGSRWVHPTDLAPTEFGKEAIYDDFTKFGFSPRIGISWDPFGTGTTAVRAGFGLFYDHLGPLYNSAVPVEPPFGQFSLKLFPSFPNETIALGPPYFLESIAPTHSPYVMHFNLNVQRQISRDMEFTVGYA